MIILSLNLHELFYSPFIHVDICFFQLIKSRKWTDRLRNRHILIGKNRCLTLRCTVILFSILLARYACPYKLHMNQALFIMKELNLVNSNVSANGVSTENMVWLHATNITLAPSSCYCLMYM